MKDAQILKLVDHVLSEAEDAILFDQGSRCADILSNLYRIVHSHIKSHSCHSVHVYWRKQTREDYLKYRAEMEEI